MSSQKKPEALTIATLQSLNHHDRLRPLLAKQQMLRTQAASLGTELKQAEEAVAEAEKAAGTKLAFGDVSKPWQPGPELAEAKRHAEDLASRSRILAHALTALEDEIGSETEAVRADIAHVLRQDVIEGLNTLMDHLEMVQKDYEALQALLQHGLRLLGQEARYIVPTELFQPGLAQHLDTLKRHASQLAAAQKPRA